MDYESSVKASVTADRAAKGNGHTLDDILYLIMGEASLANLFVMIFAIIFFGATPLAMIFLFGAYSGGMRWLITLGSITVMGFVAVYLMKRGIASTRGGHAGKEAQTIFPGQLSGLTETVERAASGYVYSQQVLRERLCDDILDKIGLARDLGPDEMAAMLEKKQTDFVGDEVLAKFLLTFRRGVRGWDDTAAQSKGKSAERGRKFMLEIDEIMRRMEAIV